MRPVLRQLLDLLALERIEEDIFRGQSQDLGWGAIFGGQVLGQALSAAAQTVPPTRQVHSLHGYFLRQGDARRPVVYEVDRIRDGGSFTTRRVVAIQAGRPIFSLSASFQEEEEGFSHQAPMPGLPGPEGLTSERELARSLAGHLPDSMVGRFTSDRPIEIRPINPNNPLNPVVGAPQTAVWLRASDPLHDAASTPGGVEALHRYLLAYASDFHFLTTALRPHGVSWLSPGMQIASLDHAMWFYRPIRMDAWLLHVVESPRAHGGRGLVTGRFYDQSGELVACTVQEGLIRLRVPREP